MLAPDADALRAGIAALTQRVLPEAAAAYGTVLSNGSPGQVSHTVRVAVAACTGCGTRQRLFPHALVSLLARVERNQPEAFLACPNGPLFEGRRDRPKACPTCGTRTEPDTAYTPRRQATCSCGHSKRLEARAGDGLDWEVVLVERAGVNRRELALPTRSELAAAQGERWQPTRVLGPIREGQETAVLLRHGFRNWEDLYPRRQRYVVERLLELTDDCSSDQSVTTALSRPSSAPPRWRGCSPAGTATTSRATSRWPGTASTSQPCEEPQRDGCSEDQHCGCCLLACPPRARWVCTRMDAHAHRLAAVAL